MISRPCFTIVPRRVVQLKLDLHALRLGRVGQRAGTVGRLTRDHRSMVRRIAQLGDAQLDRASPGLAVPIEVAIALRALLGALQRLREVCCVAENGKVAGGLQGPLSPFRCISSGGKRFFSQKRIECHNHL